MTAWRTANPVITNGALLLCGEAMVSYSEEAAQRRLAHSLHNAGRSRTLLQIGYGLGLAHHYLVQQDSLELWTIEGNKWLATECIMESAETAKMVTIFDTWEHALPRLPATYFDAVLFDPYPFDERALGLTTWSTKFEFVLTKAVVPIHHVLSQEGLLGFLNFEPEVCTSSWIERVLGGHFTVEASPGESPLESEAATLPQPYLLRKTTSLDNRQVSRRRDRDLPSR